MYGRAGLCLLFIHGHIQVELHINESTFALKGGYPAEEEYSFGSLYSIRS